jgi:DeoR/GlpR family transcriptional regulator of sugar metabolism
LDQVHVDYAFIGGTGFSFERGVTIPDLEEAHTKKKMAQIADNTVVVADHWKIGKDSMFTAVALQDVDTLITGNGGPGEQLSKIEEAGVRVIDVSP